MVRKSLSPTLKRPVKKLTSEHNNVLPLTDFTGGLNTYVAPQYINDNEVQDCSNVLFDEIPGTVVKRPGITLLSTLPVNEAVLRLYTYSKSDGSQYLIAQTSSFKIYYSANRQNWTLLPTSNTLTGLCDFETFENMLWITNGINEVRIFDGTNVWILDGRTYSSGAIPPTETYPYITPNVPRGKFIQLWNDRLFIANTTDNNSEVRFSRFYNDSGLSIRAYNKDAWPSINQIAVAQDDGGGITSIKVYFNSLVCFKTGSMYAIKGITPTDYSLFRIPTIYSTLYHFSARVYKGFLMFLGQDGIYSYNGSVVNKISMKIENIMKKIQQVLVRFLQWIITSQDNWQNGITKQNIDYLSVPGSIQQLKPFRSWDKDSYSETNWYSGGTRTNLEITAGGQLILSGQPEQWGDVYPAETLPEAVGWSVYIPPGTTRVLYTSPTRLYVDVSTAFCDTFKSGVSAANSTGNTMEVKLRVNNWSYSTYSSQAPVHFQITDGTRAAGVALWTDKGLFSEYGGASRFFDISFAGGVYHILRICLINNTATLYIDGTSVASLTLTTTASTNMVFFRVFSSGTGINGQAEFDYVRYVSGIYSSPKYDGNYVSYAWDTGALSPSWGNFDAYSFLKKWTGDIIFGLDSNYGVVYKTQSSIDGSSWDSEITATPGQTIGSASKRYIRFKIYLTDHEYGTPQIDWVQLNQASGNGLWISQKQYLGQVSAYATFLANYNKNGQTLNMYIRTATSESGLDSAIWHLIDNGQIPNELTGNNIWIQLKAELSTTDWQYLPILNSMIVQYYTGGLPTQQAVGWIWKNRYLLACASQNSQVNDTIIVLDQNNSYTKFSGINLASVCEWGQDLLGGSSQNDGKIYVLFTPGVYNDNGQPINAYFTTKSLSFGTFDNLKTVKHIFVDCQRDSNYTLSLDYTFDSYPSKTLSLAVSPDGFMNQRFNILASSPDNARGKLLKLKFYNNNLNETFGINGCQIYWQLLKIR